MLTVMTQDFFTLAYPVCVFGCLVCGSSPIAMIIDFIDVSRWENP